MSLDKDDLAYVWDMLTAAKAVVSFVKGRTLDDYVSDLMLRSAVERQVEIIGEAARRISKPFQEALPRSRGGRSRPSGMCWPTTMARSGMIGCGASRPTTFLS